MTKGCLYFEVNDRTKRGPLRIAHLPGESQLVAYSVHGAIAEHYEVDDQTEGITRLDNRLRYLGDGWLNDGHFWRRAGCASN
jgi:hypothetical protein